MSSDTTPLIEELLALSKQPGFDSDAWVQVQALQLSRRISSKLQKPADAAIELCFYVRMNHREWQQ